MRRWYAVKTNARGEEWAARVLDVTSGGRVETYLPKVKGRSTRGPSAQRMHPLFPGYIFARFEAESDDLTLVKRSMGVAYVLGYDGGPTPVPDDLISAIRHRLQESLADSERGFFPGEKVVLTEGALKDVETIFDRRLSPAGRCRVLLRIMGRYVVAQVEEERLARIDGSIL